MKHPLRLAFVSNTLWSIVHFRMKVVMDQLERGCTVFLIAPDDETRARLPQHERLIFVPLAELQAHGRSPLADLRLRHELERIYQEHRPDIIFHYTIKPNIWGTLAASNLPSVRSVAVVTGLGHAFSRKGVLHWIAGKLYARALRHASDTWFLNQRDLDTFRKEGIIAQDRGSILPGEGVDCRSFVPTPLPSPDNSVVFLMVARIKEAKGVREYVKAASLLREKHPGKNLSVHLVGRYAEHEPDAIPNAEFREWLERGSLTYHPYVDDLRPLIAMADAVVLPSRSEGMNMSLMEAASMGRPLITTDVPGCRELVIPDRSGLTVPPGDAHALAAAMERIMDMTQAERANMGIKGRDLMLSTYDDTIILSLYRERINRLTGTP